MLEIEEELQEALTKLIFGYHPGICTANGSPTPEIEQQKVGKRCDILRIQPLYAQRGKFNNANTGDRIREIERVGGRHSISVAGISLADGPVSNTEDLSIVKEEIGWVHVELNNKVAAYGAGELIEGVVLLRLKEN